MLLLWRVADIYNLSRELFDSSPGLLYVNLVIQFSLFFALLTVKMVPKLCRKTTETTPGKIIYTLLKKKRFIKPSYGVILEIIL